MFEALARAAERRMSEFRAQGIANTTWAFATSGQVDKELFVVVAREAECRMSEFNRQELANTA